MNLQSENIHWLFEAATKFYNKDIAVTRNDLYDQLDLLAYLKETLVQEKVKVDEHDPMSEQLVIKFYLHGQSLAKIGEGFNITSKYLDTEPLSELRYIDISSLFAIGRAQLETLLMYNHIYVNSNEIAEQKLRYNSWIYTALLQRKNIPAETKEGKMQKERDILHMETLKSKIASSPRFAELKPNQQRSIFETGSSKLFKHWNVIFEESNYPKDGMFSKLYYILSAYAHSEGLSVIQLKSSLHLLKNKSNSEYVFLQTLASVIMTSCMIQNIVKRFPAISKRYDTIDEKIRYNVYFYSQLGKGPIA